MSVATVLNADCLSSLQNMNDEEIFDLCLIDAPYFDYKTGHRKNKTGKLSQSLIQQPKDEQIQVVWECIKRLKQGHAFYYFTNWQEAWWFQESFHSFLRNEIIWDKGNWAAGDLFGSFGNRYEVAFLGTKGDGWKYRGGRDNDIWQIPRVGANRIHATEKPVDLYHKCIEVATDEEDFILDPYLGSGASAIAALETNRNILGYELDTEYYKGIMKRLEDWKLVH